MSWWIFVYVINIVLRRPQWCRSCYFQCYLNFENLSISESLSFHVGNKTYKVRGWQEEIRKAKSGCCAEPASQSSMMRHPHCQMALPPFKEVLMKCFVVRQGRLACVQGDMLACLDTAYFLCISRYWAQDWELFPFWRKALLIWNIFFCWKRIFCRFGLLDRERRNAISSTPSQDPAIVCFPVSISQGNCSWSLSSQSESL